MGTGYTRNDTSNNIADGNIINASDLDGEFNAIESAMGTSGHTHDGTSAEGGPVTVIGPVQDFIASGTAFTAKGTGYDLGSTGTEFEDLFLTGKAYIDGFGESTLFDTTSKIQFRDSTLFINSSADGQLDLESDTTIELTAPTVALTNDLKLQSDSAVLTFGADDEVTVTHVHNTGLDVKAAGGIDLNLQTSEISVETGNVLGKITFNSPNESAGSSAVVAGAAIEAVAEDTFASNNNSSALVFKTNTDGAATERMRIKSDGNISLTGATTISNTSGDLTLDVVGELIIDTDLQGEGNGVLLKDGGIFYGNIFRTDSDLVLMSVASDEDLIFKGNDGGSTITALTLDMSEAGAATFNSTITLKDTLNISSTSTTGFLQASSNVLQFGTSSNDRIDFYANNDIAAVINADRSFTFNYSISGTNATFTSATAEEPLVILKNTTNDANSAILRFVKDKGAAGVDGDDAGEIEFYADNDAQEQILFARIKGEVKDASDGAEGGRFKFQVASHDGEMITGLSLSDGNAEDEVDVVIGNGTDSLTEIAGDLLIPNGAISLGQTNFSGGSVLADLHASGNGVGSQIAFANDHNTDKFFVGLTGNTTGNAMLYQQKNADIEFYTNNAFQAILDSNGNFGIGTASPTGSLSVSDATYLSNSSTLGSSITLNSENTASWLGTRELISFESVGNGADHRTGTLSLKLKKAVSDTTLTEFMTINAVSNYTAFTSGNLIVGGTSVDASGSVALKSDGTIRQVIASGAGNDTLICGISGISNGYQISIDTSNNQIYKWFNGGTQSMTLDASGNLLVGTTSGYPGAGNTNTGNMLQNVGTGYFSRADGYPLGVNRNSDGTLINLGKDGSSVGSIGVAQSGDRTYFAGGSYGIASDTSEATIMPCGTTGTGNDATVDLGKSDARFKDLYLSGGVDFGGAVNSGGVVSSSNKLDDYEEGTWTPTAYTGSISFNKAWYTKVGNLVTVSANVYNFSDTTSSGSSVGIKDLPFTSSSNASAVGSIIGRYISSSTGYSAYIGASDVAVYFYEAPEATDTYETMKHSDLGGSTTDFIFQITYRVG